MKKILITLAAVVMFSSPVMAAENYVKIHNISVNSNAITQVTIESNKSVVECVVYKGGVPVGSGRGYTIARIANITISTTPRKGKVTVKCFP